MALQVERPPPLHSPPILRPALKAKLVEMTLPDKPNSQKQRYRRTAQGEALAEQIKRKNTPT